MNSSFRSSLLIATATLALAACKKDDDNAPAVTVKAQTVTTLSAAGPVSASGQPATAKHYTFYSLADGKEIAYTDSNSTKWDVAFRATTILINGGTSGPGQGGAQVYGGPLLFAELSTAPTTGYAVDAATGRAIPTGSNNGWYFYNTSTNVITPIAGKVLLIRTASGKYAKMEIQSYYKDEKTGAPVLGTPVSTNLSGYYTFRYVYQANGTSFQ